MRGLRGGEQGEQAAQRGDKAIRHEPFLAQLS
jgi:hypothetical protein